MHPEAKGDRASDCPVCGMKLVPLAPEKSAAPGAATDAAGLASVSVPQEARARMGLGFGVAERRAVRRDVRAPARIAPDQSLVYRIVAPAEGWIEWTWVTGAGERVAKSTPLIKFQREGKISGSAVLSSPADAFVFEKTVTVGQKVNPGDPLLVLVDLSKVWAEVDLFESDLAWVKPGMAAVVTFPYWPGRSFRGRITLVSPFLDRETRSLKARVELLNPAFLLKPEMTGTAHVAVELGRRLVVPEGAVLRTGEKAWVFRAGEGDRLDPVPVTLGARVDGAWEVVSGVAEGDRLVSSATFLVDSESSLHAALQAVGGR
jgi:hypothetical protein